MEWDTPGDRIVAPGGGGAAAAGAGARDAVRGLARVGLTGGIGAGKSTVAQHWREAGVTVIDLDQHARAVLDVPGEGVEEAVARFGEEFRAPSGTIDRAAMARLVFADAQARADLEAIVLGRVDQAVARAEAEALAAGSALIVHDSPLLLEKHRESEYDLVVAVLAPIQERIRRIVTTRDRDRDYAVSVMAAQVGDLERIRRADLLVMNSADEESLRRRALRTLERIRSFVGGGA